MGRGPHPPSIRRAGRFPGVGEKSRGFLLAARLTTPIGFSPARFAGRGSDLHTGMGTRDFRGRNFAHQGVFPCVGLVAGCGSAPGGLLGFQLTFLFRICGPRGEHVTGSCEGQWIGAGLRDRSRLKPITPAPDCPDGCNERKGNAILGPSGGAVTNDPITKNDGVGDGGFAPQRFEGPGRGFHGGGR